MQISNVVAKASEKSLSVIFLTHYFRLLKSMQTYNVVGKVQ